MPWAMPPCCWPVDEQRVEDPAAVVDGDVADGARPGRSRVSTSTTATWAPKGKRGAALDGSRPTPASALALRSTASRASSAQRQGPGRHAGHADPAVVGDDDVVGAGLELAAASSRARSSTSSVAVEHGAAADLQRPRAAGAPARRHHGGVGLDEADRLDRDAERSATIMANEVAWPWPWPEVPDRDRRRAVARGPRPRRTPGRRRRR